MRPPAAPPLECRSLRTGRAAAATVVALLAAMLYAHATSAAEARDESERWVPAFGPYFDVLGQKGRGSATASDILGTPLTTGGCVENANSPNPSQRGDLCFSTRYGQPRGRLPYPKGIIPGSRSSDTSVTPLVGASLELMTPSFTDALARPRLFARGELAAAFGFERNLAGVIRPGDFAASTVVTRNLDVEELSVEGQGSRARMQLERWVISAGGGLAFSTDLFRRRLRIKPSFEYLRQEIELIGVVHRAVKLREPAQLHSLQDFRLISLSSTKTIALEGFGPGLEIEVDTARLGPFLTSVYLMGRGYYFFRNLDHTLTATNTDPDGCDASGSCETATWTFALDPWAWRSGVGIRFRWLPE